MNKENGIIKKCYMTAKRFIQEVKSIFKDFIGKNKVFVKATLFVILIGVYSMFVGSFNRIVQMSLITTPILITILENSGKVSNILKENKGECMDEDGYYKISLGRSYLAGFVIASVIELILLIVELHSI